MEEKEEDEKEKSRRHILNLVKKHVQNYEDSLYGNEYDVLVALTSNQLRDVNNLDRRQFTVFIDMIHKHPDLFPITNYIYDIIKYYTDRLDWVYLYYKKIRDVKFLDVLIDTGFMYKHRVDFLEKTDVYNSLRKGCTCSDRIYKNISHYILRHMITI